MIAASEPRAIVKPSLTMITRDPLCKPWKRASIVLLEARRRKWEVVMALDQRSCRECKDAITKFGTMRIVPFTPSNDSCADMYDPIVRHATGKQVLMVADDEEPSRSLWDFAEHPPRLANYAVKLVTPTPDGRVYVLGTEIQVRLVDPTSWKWVGGVEGFDGITGLRVRAEDMVLWHFATCAPREVREAKLATYMTMGADDGFGDRHLWERRPDAIIRMSDKLKQEYPGLAAT